MALLNRAICLLVLLAVLSLAQSQAAQGGPHTSQGGPHTSQGGSHESEGGPNDDQGRVKRQAEQDDEGSGVVSWTACDPAVTPKYSCQDCNSRLICLPIGGKVKACPSVYRPYCNNGRCSAVPSAGCA